MPKRQPPSAPSRKTRPHGYATLARLSGADAASRARIRRRRIAAYEQVAADPAVDPAYQDVARLRGAYLRVDSDDPKQFEQRYAAYAGPDSPYRNAYRELLALGRYTAWRFHQRGALVRDIAAADPRSPPALRAPR